MSDEIAIVNNVGQIPPTPESNLVDAVIRVHRSLGDNCDDVIDSLGLSSVRVEPKYETRKTLNGDTTEKEARQAPR